MKRLAVILFSVLTCQLFGQNHVSNELIVQLKQERNIDQVILDLNGLISTGNFTVEEKLVNRLNIWLLHYDEGLLPKEKALEVVREHPGVYLAQLNHNNITSRAVPDDSAYTTLWHHDNQGGPGAVVDADMDSDLAWDLATGGVTALGDTIVVAVIDEACDIHHEDLQYWVNRNEIEGNGIDDDENGYIDDIYGWNTHDNNGDVISGPGETHSTHISGIIGAIGDNGIGVVGVNWDVKLMCVDGSSTTESVVIKSYGYVHELRAMYNETNGNKGAYVVATNSSFGVDFGNPADYPVWCDFYNSLGKVGILNAVAGPNNNVNIDQVGDVPGTCTSKYTLSVTSTDDLDERDGTGYGPVHCDIGAPGEGIYSTLPGSNYGSKSGTSMATPQVAGAIALMYSAVPEQIFTNNNQTAPNSIASTIRNYILTEGFDSLPDLQGDCVTGGRLNLFKAITAAMNYDTTSVGVQNTTFENQKVVVYPNPARDRVYLDNIPSGTDIKIYNLLGKVVKTVKIESLEEGIDVTELTDGVYFLAVGENEQTIRFKVTR